MNILFITNHYLDNNSGGCFASKAYIRAFSEISNRFTLLYPERLCPTFYFSLPITGNVIPVTDKRNIFMKAFNLFVGISHRFIKHAKLIIDNIAPDVVVFDNSRCSLGILEYAKKRNIKTIVIHHNCEQEYYRDEVRRIPFSFNKIVSLLVYRSVKKSEQSSVLNSDLNLTLTTTDVELLKKYYKIPESARFDLLGCFEYQDSKQTTLIINNVNPYGFVITGNLSAIQTEASLSHFLTDYWKYVKNYYPMISLTIAGRNPSERLEFLIKSIGGIELIANPQSIDDIILRNNFYICPADSGGGIKLRIMDGLKHGLKVIVHSMSERGYEQFGFCGALVKFDDVDSFVASIHELLNSNSTGLDSTEISKLYSRIFSFEAGKIRVTQIINNFYSKIIK